MLIASKDSAFYLSLRKNLANERKTGKIQPAGGCKKKVDFGVYLDGGDDGEILLPTRYVPEGCKPGDVLNVFLYLDNRKG